MTLTKRQKRKKSAAKAATDVTVSVEFAGICLYVTHRERPNDTRTPPSRVTVLMPTCVPNQSVSAKHEDGDTGARHVPYLLMDLANLDQRVPPGPVGDGPQFEVVRRLRREEILFDPIEPEGSVVELDPSPLPLPDLSVYKPAIALKEGVFSDPPPNELQELNVRTILRGGKLTATTLGGSGRRNVGTDHGRDWDKFETDWVGSIKWTRTIARDVLDETPFTIRIRSWETGEITPLTLTPVKRNGGEVIELKIADLCETNPLEWKDFEPRFDKDDVDFKWLFRLFTAPNPNDRGSLLKAIERAKFPYPFLRPRGARTAGTQGCTGGQFGLP
jgi:hypothetical protein